MQHPVYNRYGTNPYASPPELHDLSICDECGGKTGITGESLWPTICQPCYQRSWEEE